MNDQPNRLTADMYEPLLNNEFTVHVDEANLVAATLTEVTRLPPATDREDLPMIRKDPFSLIFKVNDQEVKLEQRTYRVEHLSNGITEMFLVPVGFGEYQAIFN